MAATTSSSSTINLTIHPNLITFGCYVRNEQPLLRIYGWSVVHFSGYEMCLWRFTIATGRFWKRKDHLLHLLAGLLSPTSGTVTLAGKEISGMGQQERDRFRGQHIGIVFQSAHFVQSLNVIDNLVLPQYLSGRTVDK